MKTLKRSNFFDQIISRFTIAKFISALLTIIIIASVKYAISGNLYIEYSEFFINVAIGLLGWSVNNSFIGLLSEFLGIKGINFNLKQLIFGLETLKEDGTSSSENKPKLYLSMESNEQLNSSGKPNKLSTGSKDKPISVSSRSTTPLENSKEYWEAQCKVFKDGLSSLGKSDDLLTSGEQHAKRELSRLNMYTQEEMEKAYYENVRNMEYPGDYEFQRRQGVLNKLSRTAEMQTESFKLKEEIRLAELAESNLSKQASVEALLKEKSTISDSLSKLKKIAEYNYKNNTNIPVSSGIPGDISSKLTKAENDCLVKLINKDAHAPLDVRNRIINKTIQGNINTQSVIFDYLEKKIK